MNTINLEPIVKGLYAGIVLGLMAGLGEALSGGDAPILWGLYSGVVALAFRTGVEPATAKATRKVQERQHARVG